MKLPAPIREKLGIHLFLCAAGLALLAAAVMLFASASGTWLPARARVKRTAVEPTRPGTPAWSLMVDFEYQTDGTTASRSRLDVFHDGDRAVTEARLAEWPPGKEFTVHYRQGAPGRVALHPISGGEAVLAALLLLMAAALAVPTLVAWRSPKGPERPPERR